MRITDKENVAINGNPSTIFKAFVWSDDSAAWVFDGQYSAEGYDADDAACEAAYWESVELADDLGL
jgi:hypothetical protein